MEKRTKISEFYKTIVTSTLDSYRALLSLLVCISLSIVGYTCMFILIFLLTLNN